MIRRVGDLEVRGLERPYDPERSGRLFELERAGEVRRLFLPAGEAPSSQTELTSMDNHQVEAWWGRASPKPPDGKSGSDTWRVALPEDDTPPHESRQANFLIPAAHQLLAVEGDLREQAEFGPPKQVLADFVKEAEYRRAPIKPGLRLYRCRVPNQTDDIYHPQPVDVGPPPGPASGGRFNSPELRALYLASNPHTAVAETAPGNGVNVWIAEFVVGQDLVLVDLHSPGGRTDTPADGFWESAAIMYTRVLDRTDDDRYIGAQFFSQGLVDEGYAGLSYRTWIDRDATNYAVFPVAHSKLILDRITLYEVIDSERGLTRPLETVWSRS